MESGSAGTKRLKKRKQSAYGCDGGLVYELSRDPEHKTAQILSPDLLSRLITGVSGKPPKLCTQKAEKFPELLGGGDAPRVY
jgi:hypothetical protein